MFTVEIPRNNYQQEVERYYREGIIDGGQQYDEKIVVWMASNNLAPSMSAAAPDVMSAPVQTTYLWRYRTLGLQQFYKNSSYKWRPQYQRWGTCVGQCAKLGADTVQSINSVLYQRPFAGRVSVAGTYTFSRVEIGEQPGAWQGSSCGWAAAGMNRKGLLLLNSLGLDEEQSDYGSADEQLAMKWTNSRQGVPDNFEALAADHTIVSTPRVGNIQEAAALISNASPLIIGCTLIPSGRRGTYGISPVARSRQGHATLMDGVLVIDGKIVAFHYQNSWDLWGSGTVYPDDMPDGSCWIDAQEFAAMVQQNDCYGLVDFAGLRPRTLATGSAARSLII